MAVILLWGILRINCPNSEMIIYLYLIGCTIRFGFIESQLDIQIAVGWKASISLKQAEILYLLELQIIIKGIFHEAFIACYDDRGTKQWFTGSRL